MSARVLVECPSDEALVAFALGKLDEGERVVIEAHLDVCDTCQFLAADAVHVETLAAAITAPAGTTVELDWNKTFPRGTLVGRRYVIQRFIPGGGMGEVYEAFDRALNQRVALKTVRSTASDDARAVGRLKAEVQLARLVSHQNVCRIYDLGTHVLPGAGAELHFLTMEFVEGETLGQRVRLCGALPFAEAEKVARELLLALGAAHDAGVLHRDFKSDNVMLKAAPNGMSSAIVLDFGLARGLDRELARSISNPNVVGTVGYIAPEQFEGVPYSIASDLYSFGVVWYEMLTGQMPLEAASASRATPSRPTPPSLFDSIPPPSSLNPEVPKALDALVLRCLERAPERRFASVDALLAALDEATEGPTVRRRRTVLAASIIGSGLLAAGLYLLVQGLSGGAVSRVPVAPAIHVVQKVAPPPTSSLPTATRVAVGEPPTNNPQSKPDPHGKVEPPRPPGKNATTASSAREKPVAVSPPPAPPTSSTGSEQSAKPPVGVPPPDPAVVPKRPNWENPFGAMGHAELLAGSKVPI
ncbi:MAG TPA: protein kinase [Polyangiaceae bacterium]|nr:protein kinase [Polyangiaceae bacterium]